MEDLEKAKNENAVRCNDLLDGDNKKITHTIKANSKPLSFFIEAINHRLSSSEGLFNVGKFPENPVRFETEKSRTTASETVVTFYPSDSLMDFAATIFRCM